MGTPDDVAGAVLYLASPAASWVTGENILVAGGRTQRTYQYGLAVSEADDGSNQGESN